MTDTNSKIRPGIRAKDVIRTGVVGNCIYEHPLSAGCDVFLFAMDGGGAILSRRADLAPLLPNPGDRVSVSLMNGIATATVVVPNVMRKNYTAVHIDGDTDIMPVPTVSLTLIDYPGKEEK